MSYDKLSLASFKEALKANKYVNATGARRAVGKASTLSDADKDKARAAIDAHFGAAPAAPAPKKAAAVPKKAAAKKAAAAPKKQAAPKKAAAAAKTAPKKASSGAGTAKRASRHAAGTNAGPIAEAAVGQAINPLGGIDFENIDSIATQMKIAEKTIQNVGAALSVITQAKAQYPDADLGSVVEEMGGTLSGAVNIFRNVVHSVATKSGGASASEPLIESPTPVVNHGVVPGRAQGLFQESSPEGAPAQG